MKLLLRELTALLLTVLLFGGAFAQEMPAQSAVPESFVMTEPSATPEPTLAPLTDEEVQQLMLALFGAVIGTDTQSEREIRKQIEQEIRNAPVETVMPYTAEPSAEPTPIPLTKEEQIELALKERSVLLREYRVQTLPYLMAVLVPMEEKIDSSASSTPLPPPTPTLSPTPTLTFEGEKAVPEIVYTVEDSFAAFAENEFAQEYLAMLEPLGGVDLESSLRVSRQICEKWFEQIDHEKMLWMNEDYVCWIYAPNTYIDYPVVQTDNNSEYLDKMFNGRHNAAGTLFVDYRNLPDFQDPNTLIYGHNMRNNSMFGALTDYEDQAYYEAHPYMLTFDDGEIYLVEVFAAYITSDEDHCYDIAISGEEDMALFVNTALRKSDIETGVEVQMNDRLITLSTCAYAFEDARYIAIGRLVEIWSNKASK